MSKSLIVSIAACLVAVACSGGGGQAATVATSSTNSTASTASSSVPSTDAETTATSTTTTTTTTTAPPSVFAFKPQEVILRLEDLPAGWAETPLEEEEEDGEPDCGDEVFIAAGITDDDLDADGADSADSTFSLGAFGPFLIVSVIGDTDGAAGVFDLLPEAMAACDGTVDDDGNTTSVLPVSFPKIGDDTFAARMDIEGFFPVSMLFSLVREGDVVLLAAYVAIGGAVDGELLETALRTMHSRI